MHCLIFCAGTNGDCFPLFVLARHLRRRGHRVTVVAPGVYAGAPALADVDFQCLSTEREHERFIADAGMLAGRYGLLFCRHHAVPWNLTAWRVIESLNARDLLVLAPDQPFFWADVAATLELGCAAVRFQIELPHPWNDPVGPAHLPHGRIQEHLAARLALLWHEEAVKARIPPGGASLASLSRALPDFPTIALWPDWFAGGPREQWKAHRFGFLLSDPGSHQFPESDVPAMNGHIVFKRGPTDSWPDRFYSACIGACRRMGMRGLLLDEMPSRADLSPEIIWRRFIPMDRALENARVLIHNGGIGTTATAIKCGVPQIIVPLMVDQPMNAELMRKLGVAAVIPPGRFTVDALCRQIGRLAGSEPLRTRSLELSSRIDSHADSERICEFLENVPMGDPRNTPALVSPLN